MIFVQLFDDNFCDNLFFSILIDQNNKKKKRDRKKEHDMSIKEGCLKIVTNVI